MQKAIKICIRNESCRRYGRLRGLSVASRPHLTFHYDDVSGGSVTLYASTHRDALGVVTLIVSLPKIIFIASVHTFSKFALI